MAELEAVWELEDCCRPEDTARAGQWGQRMQNNIRLCPEDEAIPKDKFAGPVDCRADSGSSLIVDPPPLGHLD